MSKQNRNAMQEPLQMDPGIRAALNKERRSYSAADRAAEVRGRRKKAAVIFGSVAMAVVTGVGLAKGAIRVESGPVEGVTQEQVDAANTARSTYEVDPALAERAQASREQKAAREAEFMRKLQEAIDTGEVLPKDETLIIDRGVRKRDFDGEKVGVTKNVTTVSNWIEFDGMILLPDGKGELDYMDMSILHQTDDTTGNPYVKRVDTPLGAALKEEGSLRFEDGNFSLVHPDGVQQAVGFVRSYETMAAAESAIG